MARLLPPAEAHIRVAAAAAAAATSATVAVADESPGSPAMVTQTSSFLRVVTSLEFLAGQEPHGTYLSPSLNALLSLVWCTGASHTLDGSEWTADIFCVCVFVFRWSLYRLAPNS